MKNKEIKIDGITYKVSATTERGVKDGIAMLKKSLNLKKPNLTMEKKKAGNPNLYKGMPSLNPNGRPKGAKNKTTENIRKAYQQLTEDNLDNMTVWLAQIAADDPKQAMEMMIKLSDFVIPKLARTELVGDNGDDLFKNIKFEFGPDINSETEREQDV